MCSFVFGNSAYPYEFYGRRIVQVASLRQTVAFQAPDIMTASEVPKTRIGCYGSPLHRMQKDAISQSVSPKAGNARP
jgi:hypothetical protein